MARYRLDVCAIFDTEKPSEKQSAEALGLVSNSCPHDFNIRESGYCSMYDCWSCWYKALEEGVINGCKSVHVERLD